MAVARTASVLSSRSTMGILTFSILWLCGGLHWCSNTHLLGTALPIQPISQQGRHEIHNRQKNGDLLQVLRIWSPIRECIDKQKKGSQKNHAVLAQKSAAGC